MSHIDTIELTDEQLKNVTVFDYGPPPVRRKRTLIVKVLVLEVDTGEQIREHKIDFFDDQQLAWFKNMLFWATMNYKFVQIYNIKDAS